ncbi:MAG: hypothetical protein IT350_00090 [Deltaproteobacteria bacterium]|nr:hypothetical protein [Deltaproteobacteria bacterium]
MLSNLPLHPAIVHLPLGLAFVAPVVAVILLGLALAGKLARTHVLIAVVLQVVLVASAMVALQTGEGAEDRAERVVNERFIEEHEHRAQTFTVVAAATLASMLGALALAGRPMGARAAIALTLAMTVGVAGLAVRTGHAGGELVYVHGAAAAWTGSAFATKGTAAAPTSNAKGVNHEEDEDD